MMTLRFSVIISSRGRPQSLLRTLTAVRQLDYPSFEVIVVGDAPALRALQNAKVSWVRSFHFERPQLSMSRNIGIEAAQGDVCAFVDDDAVPEPMWLQHFEKAFSNFGVAAAVGYVRGPDGIGFQSRFHTVDALGRTHDEMDVVEEPSVPRKGIERAVKLIGTNMAVQRSVLLENAGFDPAFNYFLEDSDLSTRLSQAGHQIAVVPKAEVHHALAPSDRRTPRRAPKTLFDIGRSTAIFLRKHADNPSNEMLAILHDTERRRLMESMVRGDVAPGDVSCLLSSLADGWRDGLDTQLAAPEPLKSKGGSFQPVSILPGDNTVLTARSWAKRRVVVQASSIARSEGARVTVINRSLTNRRHAVRYTSSGIWLHTGGQFAPRDRKKLSLRWCRFAQSVADEIHRVAKQRGLHDGK